ncbi:MAG: hypothetical protein ISS79_00545 [Phycisphaerae bacterium]|nr:hypothetical protein [Phycisphaerae bacterium]
MRKYNKRMAISCDSGGWKLRVFHRRPRRVNDSARLLVKCGCCDMSVKIYYDEYGMEINGVNASYDEWKSVLAPLLAQEFLKD